VSYFTLAERPVQQNGMGILPLILAAIPALASAVPSVISLFDKKPKTDPAAAAQAAAMQAEVARLQAAQAASEQRAKLALIGGAVLAVGLLIWSRRSPARRNNRRTRAVRYRRNRRVSR